jgi:hypothetical protein
MPFSVFKLVGVRHDNRIIVAIINLIILILAAVSDVLSLLLAVVSDDETCAALEHGNSPGVCTPLTQLEQVERDSNLEDSPPPSPRLHRHCSIAQLRPVSIPDISVIMNMATLAGNDHDTIRKMAEFDKYYMPGGQPGPTS